MGAQNIKLLLEYNGAAYAGWQMQPHLDTVQGRLCHALAAVLGKAPTVWVAGRTDAGVHAVGQVANFHTESTLQARRFAPALNAHLPDDISVHCSEEVSLDFNARHDSKSKRYRYRVYTGPQPAALEIGRAWLLRTHLDAGAMRDAVAPLLGEQDFESFRSVHCDAPHARRFMHSITIKEIPRPPVGVHVELEFHANAFCRHMCRILAGTLVDVGRGKFTPKDVTEILKARDRTRAGRTAPPEGLTLLGVDY